MHCLPKLCHHLQMENTPSIPSTTEQEEPAGVQRYNFLATLLSCVPLNFPYIYAPSPSTFTSSQKCFLFCSLFIILRYFILEFRNRYFSIMLSTCRFHIAPVEESKYYIIVIVVSILLAYLLRDQSHAQSFRFSPLDESLYSCEAVPLVIWFMHSNLGLSLFF